MKLCFVDVETCRLNASLGSALWECAVIVREDGAAYDTEFLWQVRPDLKAADAMALRIGGYYERCRVADRAVGSGMVLAGPKLAKGKAQPRQAHLIAGDVARLLDGALIVGANPWFDAGHIDVFLREHNHALAADYHMRDIGSVVAGYISGERTAVRNAKFAGAYPADTAEPELLTATKLTDVAVAMGFDPASYKAHTAMGDARLVRDIWNSVFP